MNVRFAPAALLVLTGCSLFGPESQDINIRMTAPVYRLAPPGQVVTVSFSIVNEGTARVYVASCGQAVLPIVQRNYPWGWEDYTGDACLALGSLLSSVPLAAGESLTGTWRWSESGRYRFRVSYTRAVTEADPRTVTGPSFDIR